MRKIRDSKGNELHTGDCVTLSSGYSRIINSQFKSALATPEIALGTIMLIGIPVGFGEDEIRAQVRYSCRLDVPMIGHDGWFAPNVLTKLF